MLVTLPENGSFAHRLSQNGYSVQICPVALHDFSKNAVLDTLVYILSSMTSSFRLYRITKKESISILYCNGGRAFLMTWIVGKFSDIKIIWHLHIIMSGRQKNLIEILGKSNTIDRILAVLNTTRGVFSGSSVYGKIEVQYNWVNPKLMADPQKLPQPSSIAMLKILIIGRISWEKGQYQFLEAMTKLDRSNFEVSLAGEFAGSKEFIDKFKTFITKMKKQGYRIQLMGYVNDIKQILDHHQFLFIPSVVPESFGITSIEAMSRGAIVVANELGSLPEFITHGESGLFYHANDPQSLPKLIDAILKNEFDLRKIQQNAHQMVQSRFHADFQLQKLNHIIEKTLFDSIDA